MLIQPQTKRLKLRQWQKADREPFAALNADPDVMEFFPATLQRCESDAMADQCRALIAARGWGFWATELLRSGEFIGFVGLHIPSLALPFSPCVEIGWRLAKPHWGQGYATEAATRALQVGFEELEVPEIVSFTSSGNRRSRAVMERIGMTKTEQSFEHPGVPQGHPLRKHCLYRISRKDWANKIA